MTVLAAVLSLMTFGTVFAVVVLAAEWLNDRGTIHLDRKTE